MTSFYTNLKVISPRIIVERKSYNLGGYHYICMRYQLNVKSMQDLNRLKVVLVEQKKTGKWLAEQLGKDPSTVSKWCSNKIQPSLEMLIKIAEVLNVDARELIIVTKKI